MIEKPFDIAIYFGIFALVVITVGFGINSINSSVAIDHNTTFFTTVEDRTESSTGLKGAADNSAEGLAGEEGSAEEASEEGFILRGFKSLISLGQTWAITKESMDEASRELPIDPIYFLVISSLLILAFAVVIYSWLRGNT